MSDGDLSAYKRKPIVEVTTVRTGHFNVYKDYWWIVTPEEEILRFRGTSWQCNMNREIVEHLAPEGCTVRQLPVVYIPIEPSYCDC